MNRVAGTGNECQICAAQMAPLFRSTLIGRHEVQYFHCAACGFVRTEAPYWLDEAYSESISRTDTGVMRRNLRLAMRMLPVISGCLDARGSYLDVAGGYGLFTRLMRDAGIDFYWDDPYTPNLVARGFEAAACKRPFAALTAFEVIEHTPDPLAFVRDALARHASSCLVFSTVTYAGPRPPDPDWWYYSRETGQHIAFFQKRTLATLAQRLGLQFHDAGGLYAFSRERLPRAWALRALASPLGLLLALPGLLLRPSLTQADQQGMAAR